MSSLSTTIMQEGRSQRHGKIWENLIKGTYRSASDSQRELTGLFDIESDHDDLGYPTQIKSTGSNTVCLADARRCSQLQEAFRLTVICWKQKGRFKHCTGVYDFYFEADAWKKNVLQDLEAPVISQFHQTINDFPQGPEAARKARAWAQEQKKIIYSQLQSKNKKTRLQLNPKIDSKNQRRLQASVSLDDLKLACSRYDFFAPDEEQHLVFYRGVQISCIQSASRQFSKVKSTVNEISAISSAATSPQQLELPLEYSRLKPVY